MGRDGTEYVVVIEFWQSWRAWQARRSERPMTAFRCATASHLAAGSTIYLQEARGVRRQHLLGEQLIQLGVLLFERLQALRLGNLHAAVFGFPIVKSCVQNPMLAAQISRLRLLFLQHRNNLVPASRRSRLQSVNRCFFMRPSFNRPDPNPFRRKLPVAGRVAPTAAAMPQPSGLDYSFGGPPPRRSSAVLRMVSAISGLLLDNIWKSTT